ncbi:MAG: hypothetical protein WCK18_14340 [Prolixibacteraceae bacterium]
MMVRITVIPMMIQFTLLIFRLISSIFFRRSVRRKVTTAPLGKEQKTYQMGGSGVTGAGKKYQNAG